MQCCEVQWIAHSTGPAAGGPAACCTWAAGGGGFRGQSASCGKVRVSNGSQHFPHTKSSVFREIGTCGWAPPRLQSPTHHNISGSVHETQNPGTSAKLPASKFTATNLTWHEIPRGRGMPALLCVARDGGVQCPALLLPTGTKTRDAAAPGDRALRHRRRSKHAEVCKPCVVRSCARARTSVVSAAPARAPCGIRRRRRGQPCALSVTPVCR